VRAGLAALAPVPRYVLVHDAARPLAPTALAERVLAALHDGADAVVPVLPLVDTVKQVDGAGFVVATLDRASLRVVQTPQGFRASVLIAAHAHAADATDDAALVEALGVPVWTVPGDPVAGKVTTPTDLARLESGLGGLRREPDPGLVGP
jgi:2-C-methyl-D-erythritol 4-phosphate cytidylyltransferase